MRHDRSRYQYLSAYLSPANRVIYISAFQEMIFIMPVVAAYYLHKGASVHDIFLIQACYRLAAFTLEIPTGYLADYWKRHYQIILAAFIWLLGMLTMLFSSGTFGLISAELLLATGTSLMSGTTAAYVYESLRLDGKVQNYHKWQSSRMTFTSSAFLVASLSGGSLFLIHPEAPTIMMAIAATLAFILALSLPYIPQEKLASVQDTRYPKNRFRISSQNACKNLSCLVLLPSLLFSISAIFFWVLPIRLHELHTSPETLGVLFSTSIALGAISAKFSVFIFDKVSPLQFGLLTAACIFFGAWLGLISDHVLLTWFGGTLAAFVGFGLGFPASLSILNHYLTDKTRATVISIQSMVTLLISGLILLLIQWLTTFCSLFSTLACFLLILLIFVMGLAPNYLRATRHFIVTNQLS